MFLFCCLKNTK